MARHETILSVFVASPSDVDEERNRLEEVIRELNIMWARDLGIRLELVRWETHAYPSFGEDPQAVINGQIPQDFDLFIGMMWYRFGTPTGRTGSGTIEEFQLAKERHGRDGSSPQMMIYFKDAPAPIPPSKLDHSQLAKIADFRASLGKEGGLFWSFISTEEFEKLVRLHLTRHVQAWRSRNCLKEQSSVFIEAKADTVKFVDQAKEDELGLLDLMEQFEDEFGMLQEITERIANATVEIGEKMQARTAETEAFNSGPDHANRKAAKRLIARAAGDMDQFVHRMKAELPLFSQHLNSGMNALIQTATISLEFNIERKDLEQIKENLEAICQFRETMKSVEEHISGFQKAVASLPRMTSAINRSKREMVNVIQLLIDEFRSAQVLAREAETSFESIVSPT